MLFLVLLSSLFAVNSYSASSGELCFHSHKLMDMHHLVYKTIADNMYLQSKLEGKPLIQTFVTFNDNNHCLKADGDAKIIAQIQEHFDEAKKNIPSPGTTEIKDIKVDVFISGIAAPFLSLPEMNSKVLYDVDKTPVTISARMLHPKIIELTYAANWGQFTKNFHLDELIWCIYPTRDKRGTRDTIVQDNGIVHQTNFANPANFQLHYQKEGNTFINLGKIKFKATLR